VSSNIAGVNNELAELEKVKSVIRLENIPSDTANSGSPDQSATIGQLVVAALKDHFINGAPIAEMLEFFRDKWGREIDKSSLSPQLSRLYARGVLGRIPSTQGWFLIEAERHIQGFRPYLRSGRIAWAQPETVNRDPSYEPLLTRDIEAADAANAGDQFFREIQQQLESPERKAQMEAIAAAQKKLKP
jgi:hypothetical protein